MADGLPTFLEIVDRLRQGKEAQKDSQNSLDRGRSRKLRVLTMYVLSGWHKTLRLQPPYTGVSTTPGPEIPKKSQKGVPGPF